MEVLHLDKASFDKLIGQSEKMVLIDFWAKWCGPCQKLAPVLDEIAAERNDIIIGKVDVDVHPEIAVSLGVDLIPAMFFYRDGKMVKKVTGYLDKGKLLAELGI